MDFYIMKEILPNAYLILKEIWDTDFETKQENRIPFSAVGKRETW